MRARTRQARARAGFTLIEMMISVAIIGGATAVGGGVNNTFTNIQGKL